MALSEAQIQRDICKYLTIRQIPFSVTDASRSFTPSGNIRQKVRTGWPDISAVLKGGQAFFIECKRKGLKPTAIQERTHEALRKQGAIVIVASSANDVLEALKSIVK